MRNIVEYRIIFRNQEKKRAEERRKKHPVANILFDITGVILLCLLAVSVLFTFGGRLVTVEGESMMPTLKDGDRLFAVEPAYTAQAGDIVIISREFTQEEPIIKRVIAVGGDTVKIDFTAKLIYVNDALLQDFGDFAPISTPGNVNYPLTVPEGCIFVLGDNRNDSKDSRNSEIGCVPVERVIGRAVARVYPMDSLSVFD